VITANWRPMIRQAERSALYTRLEDEQDGTTINKLADEDIAGKSNVTINGTISYPVPDSQRGNPNYNGESFLDYYLCDVFLLMNLSAPGCCRFYTRKKSLKRHERIASTLYAGWLENVWVDAIDNGWPAIKYLPVEKTAQWFYRIRNDCRQIAGSGTERALFALLHTATIDTVEPSAIIWLAHAIEALYNNVVA